LTRTSLDESFLLGDGETALAFEDMEEVISLEVIRDLLEVVYMHVVYTLFRLTILNKEKHYETQISIQNPEKHKELIKA